MKKRLLSILLMCCMVLTLLPTTAFAEESTETPPVCTCETACAVETMNAECSVCGAEGASAENCAKYIKPADDAAVQPEGEVSDPQPETALMALSGEGETPAASGAVTDVSTAADLTAAISNPDVNTVRLAADIDISSPLTVTRTVTLDLNGKVLRMVNNENEPVIEVKKGNSSFDIGYLTLTDSAPDAEHKFTPNADGLWVLDETNGTKTVNGGVITGGKYMGIWVEGYDKQNPTQKPDEADCAHLIMTGGNIVGCMTERNGGGVCAARHAYFTMTGGSIRGCVAKVSGGGVSLSRATVFDMGGSALIADCVSTGNTNSAGGGIDAYGSSVTLSGNAAIRNCTAELGGGVYLDSTYLTMSGNASIIGCTATNGGGGIYTRGTTGDPTGNTVVFTMKDASSIVNCTALKGGDSVFTEPSGGFTMTGGTVDGSIRLSYSVGNNTVYMDGLGTAAYPYEIGTADQLKTFRDIVNGANGQTQNPAACAKLTNDIVLNDGTFDENGKYTTGASGKAVETWTPIAYSGPFTVDTTLYYTGTFDGQGHAIKGMYVSINDASSIEDQVCLGLFSTAKNAVIRNVTVTGYVSGYAGNLGGIVGYLAGGTIENCANYCTVTDTSAAYEVPSYVGGIAGAVNCSAAIRDCYNTGKLTEHVFVRYHKTGGIVGYIGSSAVSNCYNVGKVAGKGWYNGEIIGFIAGEDEEETPSTINNCYYLNTTNEAVGNDADTVTNTGPKTAVQFGNGTVLALLINGRADSAHPWNSQCKYLAAAGRTLPVFKTQTGDAHTHDWSAWTSNGDGTHSRRCTCNAAETVNCSGGTATCTAKAKCADCGAEYGDTNPNHHGDKLKHVVAKDATTSEEGNIEYWYCEACEKYFSDADAKNGITQAQTVIPKRQSSGSNYSYYTIKATAGAGGSISPSGNVSVREGRDQTFTITPDKGYAVANVKIDGKSIGAVKSYTFENVRRTHTIEVIFMKANGNPQTGVFVDVATGSYYEDAVDWAVENGITKGTDDTHFSPDGICTRAQAVTFLWRAAGSPEPETRAMPFTDVPVGSYYYDAVLWAMEQGITKGTSDTTFSPNMTCSRAQIVAFLWRSEKSPAAGTANPFADVKSTAYYADAVLWAVKENITKGTTNTTFSPDADCTRAQIVTFLWRCKK